MNSGTESSLDEKSQTQTFEAPKPEKLDFDTRMARFIKMIARARIEKKDVEVDEDIINYLNPNGLGQLPYFHYQSVRVFKEGTKDDCLKMINMQVGQKLHGEKEGRAVHGDK